MPATAVFIGRTTLDVLYVLDSLPAEHTRVFARGFRVAPAGPDCNTTITYSLLGGEATLNLPARRIGNRYTPAGQPV